MVWLQHITPPYCDHSSGQIIIYGQGWKQTQNFHSSLCFSIWICSGILKPRFANKKLYHERRYNNDTLDFSFHLWKVTFHNISSKSLSLPNANPPKPAPNPNPWSIPFFPRNEFPPGDFNSSLLASRGSITHGQQIPETRWNSRLKRWKCLRDKWGLKSNIVSIDLQIDVL